ncbi:predicted protein [Streptomyces albidoflavus]|nr:predicted protein [Streptomyces albidoflavus]
MAGVSGHPAGHPKSAQRDETVTPGPRPGDRRKIERAVGLAYEHRLARKINL